MRPSITLIATLCASLAAATPAVPQVATTGSSQAPDLARATALCAQNSKCKAGPLDPNGGRRFTATAKAGGEIYCPASGACQLSKPPGGMGTSGGSNSPLVVNAIIAILVGLMLPADIKQPAKNPARVDVPSRSPKQTTGASGVTAAPSGIKPTVGPVLTSQPLAPASALGQGTDTRRYVKEPGKLEFPNAR